MIPKLSVLLLFVGALIPAARPQTWNFAVSGDSRNCGDIVMPAIAAGAQHDQATFYWHLGDLRAIYDFDQDFKQLVTASGAPLVIIDYQNRAWGDFIENQISPFGGTPFYLGIGNHETIPPKTRTEFIIQFADWLDTPELQQQRLKDNPKDRRLRTYYHWRKGEIDFINLDNASTEQFDRDQMAWIQTVLKADTNDPSLHTIVVGMHEALPDSISKGHSMSESAQGEASGRQVYTMLLDAQNNARKNVYLLASHSHFFMEGIFNTEYWRTHGGVLPGWIIGTAGAVRYALPPTSSDAKAAKTNVYGYLLGTVHAGGMISFHFQQLKETEIPAPVVTKFGSTLVHECFVGNRQ
jgi:hypothetical protein